ncbi:DUF421 domain-containing protein [Roseomonas elaeocarpi]|uniref:DUF421 domain-containing protein n=1 Tax=Roseomonas elaeocarpi TaxID=907779 RepID=A0ABV6JVK9_9PROT
MNTVLRAAAAYLALLLVTRVIGRRALGQAAPLDLIVLFTFGGTAITAILAEDRSFVGAMSALFTIGFMHTLVSELKQRFPAFGRIVDGTPVVVFEHGDFHRERMRRLRIMEADVMASARQRGLERLEQVKYAVVERDGRVSVIAQGEGG